MNLITFQIEGTPDNPGLQGEIDINPQQVSAVKRLESSGQVVIVMGSYQVPVTDDYNTVCRKLTNKEGGINGTTTN